MFSLNKKKIVLLISVTIIISSVLGTVIVAQGKGNAFADIWNAIFDLNSEIDELQTQISEINEIPAGYSIHAFDSG